MDNVRLGTATQLHRDRVMKTLGGPMNSHYQRIVEPFSVPASALDNPDGERRHGTQGSPGRRKIANTSRSPRVLNGASPPKKYHIMTKL